MTGTDGPGHGTAAMWVSAVRPARRRVVPGGRTGRDTARFGTHRFEHLQQPAGPAGVPAARTAEAGTAVIRRCRPR